MANTVDIHRSLVPLIVIIQYDGAIMQGDRTGGVGKAKRELGWRPKTSFKELVHLMVDADIEAIKKEKQ